MSQAHASGARKVGVRIGASRLADPREAVRELAAALATSDARLALIFASSQYDREQLAACVGEAFAGMTVVGCTTAGEIGPDGYSSGGLTGISLDGETVDFEAGLLENIRQLDARRMGAFAHGLRERLRGRHPGLGNHRCFAVMLVDGLCGREESVARAFHDGLGGIPLAGGSAGDELAFSDARVLFNGRLVGDSAVLLVATTPLPFSIFKTQHFSPTEGRLVVTGAIPEKRIVTEINGCPPAEEYARCVGLDPASLGPCAFAAHPVVVRIGDADFVRSIQRVNPDGSLSFFCAIDRGLVFKVARGEDLVANLDEAMADIRTRIGEPAFILGFDCILRLLEIRERQLTAVVGERLARNRVVGFNTFGEQYCGMHLNQTLTGIAFGQSGAHDSSA
jgi:hypothetical protein